MTSKAHVLAFGLCIFVAILGGCTTRVGDFTAISTKNIYAKGVDVTKLPQMQGVEGEDIRFLGIGANIKDAVDRALEKGRGNLMIDVALYVYWAPFVEGFKVRGTVINVPYEKVSLPEGSSSPGSGERAAARLSTQNRSAKSEIKTPDQ